jgi:hypothetical protein
LRRGQHRVDQGDDGLAGGLVLVGAERPEGSQGPLGLVMPCIIAHAYRQGAPPDVPVRDALVFEAALGPVLLVGGLERCHAGRKVADP